MIEDAHDLARFVVAQDPVFHRVLDELRAGAKRGHWMWFVFPQIAGLGVSPTARRYAIRSVDEAQAYLAHPVLGQRLRAATGVVLAIEGRTLHAIFGSPDDMKFRSSMTLFANVGEAGDPFARALHRFCEGEPDEATLRLLA